MCSSQQALLLGTKKGAEVLLNGESSFSQLESLADLHRRARLRGISAVLVISLIRYHSLQTTRFKDWKRGPEAASNSHCAASHSVTHFTKRR